MQHLHHVGSVTIYIYANICISWHVKGPKLKKFHPYKEKYDNPDVSVDCVDSFQTICS